MYEQYFESIGAALIGVIGTVTVGWFTLRGQLKSVKVDDSKANKEFILELQKQLAIEREQMNEQRLQDSKALGDNMKMIAAMQDELSLVRSEMTKVQQEMTNVQMELIQERKKSSEILEKYNKLHHDHVQLQQDFNTLNEKFLKLKNEK